MTKHVCVQQRRWSVIYLENMISSYMINLSRLQSGKYAPNEDSDSQARETLYTHVHMGCTTSELALIKISKL